MAASCWGQTSSPRSRKRRSQPGSPSEKRGFRARNGGRRRQKRRKRRRRNGGHSWRRRRRNRRLENRSGNGKMMTRGLGLSLSLMMMMMMRHQKRSRHVHVQSSAMIERSSNRRLAKPWKWNARRFVGAGSVLVVKGANINTPKDETRNPKLLIRGRRRRPGRACISGYVPRLFLSVDC
jgi:hypothetical protein